MRVKLGELTKIKTGKLDANAADVDGLYPFFTCSKEPLKINKYSYDCECVLVAGNGDLNVKYYNGKFDAYQRTYIIEVIAGDRLLPRYLYYFLDAYVEVLRKQSIGGVIKYIKLGNLTDAVLDLPSLSKQREVICALDLYNQIVDKRKEQLTLLDQLVKSRFIEMFGDPVRNDRQWRQSFLKDVTSKIGSGATPKGGKSSYLREGISFIRSMNVHDGKFVYKELAYLDTSQATALDNVCVEPYDVFVNITGASVARSCVVPKDVLPARVNQHVAIIRPLKSEINAFFLNHQFLCKPFKNYLLALGGAGGATREAITKAQLEQTKIVVPPLDLQNQFADFVAQVDKSKLAVQKSIDELEILKEFLVREYFW